MKVYQILENNDFSNQPESLSYLYKKQASAIEHFKYEMLRLIKRYPDDIDLAEWWKWLRSPSASLSAYLSLSSWWPLSLSAVLKKHPSLKTKVDDVIDAKKKYEDAGGKYNEIN